MRSLWWWTLGAVMLVGCKPGVRTEIQTMDVPRASGAITVDGRLDEPAWQRAARTGPLIDTLTGAIGHPRNAHGGVRALWNDEALWLGWTITDSTRVDLGVGQTDPHLWENDCAEVMLDPGGDGRDYYELQVGPSGSVFDTMYRTPRVPRPFGITDWNAQLRSSARATDGGYVVEMAIPWRSIGVQAPDENTVLRGNFYLMDRTPEGQKFAGWSPPMIGDFHVPDRFGHLRLRR